jgi:hypothetical protein
VARRRRRTRRRAAAPRRSCSGSNVRPQYSTGAGPGASRGPREHIQGVCAAVRATKTTMQSLGSRQRRSTCSGELLLAMPIRRMETSGTFSFLTSSLKRTGFPRTEIRLLAPRW